LLDQVVQHGHDLSFYTYVQALLLASHAIEDEFVQKHLSAPFYVGFQYFSRLRPQEPRYRAILRSSQRVVVFGLADVPLWYEPRFECVAIDVQRGTGLERFWFVVTKGPDWNSALLAENLAGGFSKPLDKRRYQGFWTFDPVIVERIAGTLDYARALMPGARQR
jgi:DICT domain-containing protein